MSIVRQLSTSLTLVIASAPAASQTKLWADQFGWAQSDEVLASAPSGGAGVFVAGYSQLISGPTDALLARYDGAGHRLWTSRYGSGASEEARGLASDPAGGAFMVGWTTGGYGGPGAGNSWLGRFDPSGKELWVKKLGMSVLGYDAASDGSGGVLVCGHAPGGFAPDTWVGRFDASGQLLWSAHHPMVSGDNWDDAQAIVSDGQGGAFLCGNSWVVSSGSEFGAWVARVAAGGALLWVVQIDITGSADQMNAVVGDGAGGVYVAGSVGDPTNSSKGDSWLARFDGEGHKLWERELGVFQHDEISALAPDGAGGVFAVSMFGANNAWLMRFDGAGNQLWLEKVTTNGANPPHTLTWDGDAGVYVGGGTTGSVSGTNAGDYDAWLARYDGSCNSGKTYCTASTTSIPGCQAAIGGTGSPTLSNPDSFTISSGSIPGGNNVGICFFGNNGPASIPFGTLGGQVCVQSPFFRSAPRSGRGSLGTCTGALGFTLQDLINASPIIVVGAAINAEIWARDPANPDGFLLSNGLSFNVCP